MKDPEQQSKVRSSDVQSILNVLVGALVVLLLVAANIQLASDGEGGTAGGETSNAGTVSVQPPVQETSNHVLAEELKHLSGKLTSPINLLREKLSPLSGLSAGQQAAATSFKGLASSFKKLGAVKKELSHLSSGLGDVVGSTEAMAGNLGDSTETLAGVGRDIGSTQQETKGMVQVMRRVEESLATTGKSTNESMARVGTGIEGMSQALASQKKELSASLTELNTNMSKFLEFFCILLTSGTECSSAPAASSAVPSKEGKELIGRP